MDNPGGVIDQGPRFMNNETDTARAWVSG
jgi:hypothetical protein